MVAVAAAAARVTVVMVRGGNSINLENVFRGFSFALRLRCPCSRDHVGKHLLHVIKRPPKNPYNKLPKRVHRKLAIEHCSHFMNTLQKQPKRPHWSPLVLPLPLVWATWWRRHLALQRVCFLGGTVPYTTKLRISLHDFHG